MPLCSPVSCGMNDSAVSRDPDFTRCDVSSREVGMALEPEAHAAQSGQEGREEGVKVTSGDTLLHVSFCFLMLPCKLITILV